MPVPTMPMLRTNTVTGAVIEPTWTAVGPKSSTEMLAPAPFWKAMPAAAVPAAISVAVPEPPGVAVAVSVLLKSPVVAGTNRTPTEQVSPGVSVLFWQAFEAIWNWAEPVTTETTPESMPPTLVTVNGTSLPIWPTATIPKLPVSGVIDQPGRDRWRCPSTVALTMPTARPDTVRVDWSWCRRWWG